MLKKIFIVFYILFAAISLYVIGSVFSFIIDSNTGYSVSFYLFNTNNSFLLMIVVIVSILLGFINLVIFANPKSEVATKTKAEDFFQKNTVEEEIAQQINNKYNDKIAEISAKVEEAIKKESKLELKIEQALWSLCNELELSQGLVYGKDAKTDDNLLHLRSTYAYIGAVENINTLEIGIGLNGQVAKSGNFVYLKDVPNGYMKIVSGLGEISPDFLLIIPINKEAKLIGLVELAGFGQLNAEEVKTVKELSQKIFTTVI
ncbi:MAG: hypothetical protein ACKVOU_07580 [Cytophagales bacterium]